VKKILIILFASIFGLVFFAWLFRTIYNKIELKKEKAITYILSENDKELIQDGDIILRYGHGLVSDYIVNTFDEEYSISHCGIVSKKNGALSVIHSESSSFLSEEGIQRQDFDDFTDAGHKHSVIIVRFNNCTGERRINIRQRAEEYLKKRIPFDYGFNPNDTTVMFCSEIIWHVFLDEFKTDIFLNNSGETDFNQFKNFWDSTHFDIILNHQTKYKPSF
jgi:uncharacterized protein YycO